MQQTVQTGQLNHMHDWAMHWGVPFAAIADLRQRLGMGFYPPQQPAKPGVLEHAIQQNMRLEAAHMGIPMWRNNRGALPNPSTGVPVRFGLANDSEKLNAEVKSSDLVGIRPVLITPAHVGATIGQFICREVKEADWMYTGTPEELAQAKWNLIVESHGGDAAFANGPGSF